MTTKNPKYEQKYRNLENIFGNEWLKQSVTIYKKHCNKCLINNSN